MSTLKSRLRGVFRALIGTTIPLHRNENSRPFFIVGSGRCGTTLLRRILQASDEIHIPPENWSLGYAIHHFERNSWQLYWEQLVDIVASAHEHRTHQWFDTPPTEFIKSAGEWPDEERSLYRLIDGLYRYHGETVGATFERWGDKTPMNVKLMEVILRVFPDASFVHLLRDGVDVAYSWSRRPDYDDVIQPSQRWKQSVAAARSFAERHPDRFLEIRYEDLCHHPEETVRQVCRFIDLSYEANLVYASDHYDELGKAQTISHFQNAFESISTDSIGKGRRRLTKEKKQAISGLIGDDLTRFGYDRIST